MPTLRFRHIGLFAAAIAVAIPAAALAGKTVVSGQQSLRLQISLSPSRAGARGAVVQFHSLYLNPKHPGQQPPYNGNMTTFRGPKGLSFNTNATPRCLESKALKNANACPPAAKVGSGSVVVNARPTIKNLITGTVAVYNGDDDKGYGGFPKGSPELILDVKTSNGLNLPQFLHVVKTRGGVPELKGQATKPSKPGVAPGGYTLQKLDLTVGSPSKAYVTNPKTCNGSWPFSLTLTNYFGQPSITATDSVKCTG